MDSITYSGYLAIIVSLYCSIKNKDYPIIVTNLVAFFLVTDITDVGLYILWYVAWLNLLVAYNKLYVLVNIVWIVAMVVEIIR